MCHMDHSQSTKTMRETDKQFTNSQAQNLSARTYTFSVEFWMFLDVREWLEWPEFSPLIFMMFAKHLLSTFNVQYFSQQNLFLTTQTFNTFDFVFKSKINIFLTFSGVSFQQAGWLWRSMVRVVWLWSYFGQKTKKTSLSKLGSWQVKMLCYPWEVWLFAEHY